MDQQTTAPAAGHNQPPSDFHLRDADALRPFLAETYADLMRRHDEIMATVPNLPKQITNDDEQGKVADFVKASQAWMKAAEAARVHEKGPYDDAADAVQAFFRVKMDKIQRGAGAKADGLIVDLARMSGEYLRAKEERIRRQREEAERKAREEAEAKRREAERLEREEAERKARAERERQEAEQRRQDEERRRQEAEAKRLAEIARQQEEERRRLAQEEERRQKEAEAARKRIEEEEARAREAADAAERERMEAEAARRRMEQAEREAAERRERNRVQHEADAKRQREAEAEAKRIQDEREKREREAAEARRIAQEKEEAAAAEAERQRQAAERAAEIAAAEAAKARAAAESKSADLTRTRGDLGSYATTREEFVFDGLDRETVDLEPLRPYLTEAAIEAAVRAFIKAGGRELRGVNIYKGRTTRFG